MPLDKNSKWSSQNPDRIRYWIRENIHMVWSQIKNLQDNRLSDLCIRIYFSKDSWPIVAQWSVKIEPLLTNRDCFVSEELWYINQNFSSINAFADWVNNVKMIAK